jgi:hypothetical protein
MAMSKGGRHDGRRGAHLLRRVRQAAELGSAALRIAGTVARTLYDVATSRGAPERPAHPRPPVAPVAVKPAAPAPAAPEPPAAEPPAAAATPASAPASPLPPDDEPIRTRTLARLLAQQGHRQRAAAMYEALLEKQPDDDELRAELAGLRAAGAEEASPDLISVAVDDHTVWVGWSVTSEGVDRARRLLGEPAPLAVRLAVTAPDPEALVRTQTRDLPDVELSGEWIVRDLPAGARATASVGVLGAGRFISIAHFRAR